MFDTLAKTTQKYPVGTRFSFEKNNYGATSAEVVGVHAKMYLITDNNGREYLESVDRLDDLVKAVGMEVTLPA